MHRKSIKSIEVEGATIKEAIQKALNILGVARDRIDIKILCEESKGLFGMNGNKLAKIRATLK
jgi:spoIIIJ-associated protein